jgi:hypothetical protein
VPGEPGMADDKRAIASTSLAVGVPKKTKSSSSSEKSVDECEEEEALASASVYPAVSVSAWTKGLEDRMYLVGRMIPSRERCAEVGRCSMRVSERISLGTRRRGQSQTSLFWVNHWMDRRRVRLLAVCTGYYRMRDQCVTMARAKC